MDRSKNSEEGNRRIAFAIGVVATVFLCATILALYFVPEYYFEKLNNSGTKALLLVMSSSLILVSSILAFTVLYTPTVRRFIYAGFRAILGYTTAVCAFSLFGWPKLSAASYDGVTGLNAKFSVGETAMEVAPLLATCFAAIAVMCIIYFVLGLAENLRESEF